jgi:ABC-type sugar transport system permease subunit
MQAAPGSSGNINGNNTNGNYIPGVCNIGPSEIKKRRNGIFPPLGLMIIAIVLMQAFHVDKLWRFIIILPAIPFAVGFLQWYYKFCVGFGLKGIFNFGDLGKTFTVEQQEYYKKDRLKAWTMIITAIFFSVAMAVTYYFLIP